MCRLYGFLSNEETKVECTLVHAQNALLMQSRSDLRGKSHPDGWGIGFYHNSHPELERRETPAFEDLYFSTTAERVFSRAVIAHVRMATVGGASLPNTHPFHHGPWVFAHNGTVTAFDQLAAHLAQESDANLQDLREGTTDSEQVFYWLLSRMNRNGISLDEPCSDLPVLTAVVGEAIEELACRCEEAKADKPAKLSFLLTDGRVMLALRWKNSLYCVFRNGIRDCEICGIPHVHHHSGVEYRAIVVASEPISHEEWQEVPDRHILAIDENIHLEMYSISNGGSGSR